MTETTDALVLDLVEWVAREPRLYSEVIETWRTSCPRLTIWEDAVDRGYVARRPRSATGCGLRSPRAARSFCASTAASALSRFHSACRFGQTRPDDLHHAVGRCARREKAEIVSVAIHQIDEGGVIDGVVAGVLAEQGPSHNRPCRHRRRLRIASAPPVSPIRRGWNIGTYSARCSGVSRSGSTVMNSGCTSSAPAPSLSIARPIACRSVGQMSGQ